MFAHLTLEFQISWKPERKDAGSELFVKKQSESFSMVREGSIFDQTGSLFYRLVFLHFQSVQ